ncbi:hypothetical protein [Chengkuizengella marina]|uniref:Uncharacterized protein n=1 Tax=Chengkuizengella marina TaxID=2507566 RepID=A0A6N9Q2B9_9BACL|nr:hypothetical protein [Chengkuizengella marina]NBI28248.1 hypothetical protein [Chengkuizengella marina]
MTNLGNSMKGDIVNIGFLTPGGGVFLDEIINVGEGIVIGRFPDDMSFTEIYSTCTITRITPFNQQQINDSSRTSNSRQFNRNTPH